MRSTKFHSIKELFLIPKPTLSSSQARLALTTLFLVQLAIFTFTQRKPVALSFFLSIGLWMLYFIKQKTLLQLMNFVSFAFLLFSHLLTLIFLIVVYLLVITPLGLIFQFLVKSPLTASKDDKVSTYRKISTPLRDTHFSEPY